MKVKNLARRVSVKAPEWLRVPGKENVIVN